MISLSVLCSRLTRAGRTCRTIRMTSGLPRLMSNSSDPVVPSPTTTPYLYLTQIPQGTQAETLHRILQQHGRVAYFRVALGLNNAWLGHAFCDYHTKKQAEAFVNATKSSPIVLTGGFTPLHVEYNSASALRYQVDADTRFAFDQREGIPPHRKLIVRHIPWATKTNSLKDFFSRWGQIQRIFHLSDAAGQPHQYAFVQFKYKKDAIVAFNELRGPDPPTFRNYRLDVQYVPEEDDLRHRPRRPVKLQDIPLTSGNSQ